MLESCCVLMDEHDPMNFPKDLSSKKSEMVISLVILEILRTKVVLAMLVQLQSLFSLGSSGLFSVLLGGREGRHAPFCLTNPTA